VITLYQLILHLVESFHDRYVIAGSDKSKVSDDRKWHKLDALQWILIHGGIAVLANDNTYLLTGLFIRLWVLQVVLNKLRGLPIKYLSKKDGTVDGLCWLFFGERWTLILKTIIFVMCLIYGWI
jgi:hypothetical protein